MPANSAIRVECTLAGRRSMRRVRWGSSRFVGGTGAPKPRREPLSDRIRFTCEQALEFPGGTHHLSYRVWASNQDRLDLARGAPVPSRPILSAKQRRQRTHFVKVPLEWAERATTAIRTPKAYILLWLLYRAWKTGSNVVVLSNGHLNGISCWTKQRALLELETAGLIEIQRGRGRAPIAQLVQSRTVIAPNLRGMGRRSLKD